MWYVLTMEYYTAKPPHFKTKTIQYAWINPTNKMLRKKLIGKYTCQRKSPTYDGSTYNFSTLQWRHSETCSVETGWAKLRCTVGWGIKSIFHLRYFKLKMGLSGCNSIISQEAPV